jgi:hypothetical protein
LPAKKKRSGRGLYDTVKLDIEKITEGISDAEKRALIRDGLMLLLAGDSDAAEKRIRLAAGEIDDIDDLSDPEFLEVLDHPSRRLCGLWFWRREQGASRATRSLLRV